MNKLRSTNLGRNLIWASLALIFVVSAYIVIALGVWFYYSGSVYPGVTVAGVSVSGKSDEEIRLTLENATSEYLKSEKANLSNYEVEYDIDGTILDAKEAFKNPFWFGRRIDIPLRFDFNERNLYQILAQKDVKYRKRVINPTIISKSGELSVKTGEAGRRIIYSKNAYRLKKYVGGLKTGYSIEPTVIEPNYTVSDIEESLDGLEKNISNGLTLTYAKRKYFVAPETVASWANVEKQNSILGPILNDVYLGVIYQGESQSQLFATDKIENYLATIAKKIDRDPVNATLTINNGKVDVFSLSRTGLELTVGSSADNIVKALEARQLTSALVVEEIEPEVSQNSLSEMGIVEKISEGRSNFAGSPTNRRHNIRVGASKFDGVLIEPGDNFSFTSILGEVDASTGYLPELVIKDNETVPEYGGGLCQVSSTTFRAALNAGLPILARRPHSYPVTYYKPYGTDATVYVPNPDLKFNNDTGKYILIQTRIVGNYLYFDFYGTKKNVVVKFAGNEKGTGAVNRAEDITPLIYGYGEQGRGSFTAKFWQFIYDSRGKLIQTEDYVSKYDSPDKYPH